MNVVVWVVLAIAAYLVPILVTFVLRARRERTLSEIALDAPFAVAADMLTILLLALLMRLETAVFVSRALWSIGGGVLVWRRWRRGGLEYPRALGVRELVPVLGAAILIVIVCSPISGDYFIWDSEWHTILVGALPGQRLPFVNALSQREIFHYHFTGDVLAATLKVLSFHVISANRALAVAHDVMFALTAATIALLVRSRGQLRGWTVALAGLGVLLHGPVPLREGAHEYSGFAYHAFLNVSYRPHYSVSVLLLIGTMVCALTRALGAPGASTRRTAPALAVLVTVLAITDESSVAIFGAFLGTLWLIHPQVIAERRLHGLLVLGSLPLLMLGANFLFNAALAPGSPVQKIEIARQFRIGTILPIAAPALDTANGKWAVFWDVFPLVSSWIGLVVHAVRTVRRAALALGFACAVPIMVGTFLALRVTINNDPSEGHRFFLAPFVITALCAMISLGAMRPGSTERVLVVLGVFVPAAAQLLWLRRVAPDSYAYVAASKDPLQNVFVTNCRKAAGARVGQAPQMAYVEPSQFFRFTGCRPVFVTGRSWGPWTTKIQANIEWYAQLIELERELPERSRPLAVVCRSNLPTADPVCVHVRKNERACRREGDEYIRCALSFAERNMLLKR